MKQKSILALALVMGFATLAVGAPEDKADQKTTAKITWHQFADAVAKARHEKKMLVVDFYTDWCTWCKVMEEKTYRAKSIVDFAKKKLVMAKVNAESNEKTQFQDKEYTYRQLAQAFGVRGFPTTAFLTENGELITLVSGYIPPEKFLPILNFLQGKHYEKMSFDEYMAKHKDEK